MGRGHFFDRDVLVSRDGSIYVVIGNAHPPGYVLAYLKYVRGEGPWRGYRRVLKQYGVKNLISSPQTMSLEPCYDVTFPILPVSQLESHLLPEEGFLKLLSRAADRQGEALMELALSLGTKELGVTGSLLTGTYHMDSDVDVLVYGCRRAIQVMEEFKGFQEDVEWISQTARTYGLSIGDAKALYDVRRRGKVKGVGYSVGFVDDRPHKYCERTCRKLGPREAVVEVEGWCDALFYPASAQVIRGVEGKVPSKVLSYEGVFSPLLFGRRKLKVVGMSMDCEGEDVLVLGDREVTGYVKEV
ncbi:nucleotidyltransferase [Sulfodiicoccus acidiphilus]|uniref:Nucleotidyltransferase n=1 Tax=Sulfodiicoccus acidiphilus TaxID=1670455 RepID=A0A348B2M2_9CREN|nr:nucleotidyltransferase domain-containing protein [Sulfodiicoccus acidiphilus]BBD72424.1 nucleotidyltransferase [Sulfodiicoccus acidiphilus]GGT97225.1 nucleotidyltransferase [Sulfodiicoccus acidiphilus]